MNSPKFCYPRGNFPHNDNYTGPFHLNVVDVDVAPQFMFKVIAGDSGLRNAVKVFWMSRGCRPSGTASMKYNNDIYEATVTGVSSDTAPDPPHRARTGSYGSHDRLKGYGQEIFDGASTTVYFGLNQFVRHNGLYGATGYAVIMHYGDGIEAGQLSPDATPETGAVKGTLNLPDVFEPSTSFWVWSNYEVMTEQTATMTVLTDEMWDRMTSRTHGGRSQASSSGSTGTTGRSGLTTGSLSTGGLRTGGLRTSGLTLGGLRGSGSLSLGGLRTGNLRIGGLTIGSLRASQGGLRRTVLQGAAGLETGGLRSGGLIHGGLQSGTLDSSGLQTGQLQT